MNNSHELNYSDSDDDCPNGLNGTGSNNPHQLSS